jgi:hypothetical protein
MQLKLFNVKEREEGRGKLILTRKTQGHPVPGGYKYGNLALQVGGVSNETVKYGHEFCGTWTRE